jgi:hypothetical protein
MVYRLTTPGHLGASTAWTAGSTTFELTLRDKSMSIAQDGRKLAETALTGPLAERLRTVSRFKPVRWGDFKSRHHLRAGIRPLLIPLHTAVASEFLYAIHVVKVVRELAHQLPAVFAASANARGSPASQCPRPPGP